MPTGRQSWPSEQVEQRGEWAETGMEVSKVYL
jgi:hypothetical protein